jgi:hypothetical protein
MGRFDCISIHVKTMYSCQCVASWCFTRNSCRFYIQCLQEKFTMRNKTALEPRGQAETSLKIEDLS